MKQGSPKLDRSTASYGGEMVKIFVYLCVYLSACCITSVYGQCLGSYDAALLEDPKEEDDLKNKDNPKIEDKLKNEDDPKKEKQP